MMIDDDDNDAAVWIFELVVPAFSPLCPSFLSALSDLYLFLFLFRRFFGPVRDPYTYSLAVRVLGFRTPLILGTWVGRSIRSSLAKILQASTYRLHSDEALEISSVGKENNRKCFNDSDYKSLLPFGHCQPALARYSLLQIKVYNAKPMGPIPVITISKHQGHGHNLHSLLNLIALFTNDTNSIIL